MLIEFFLTLRRFGLPVTLRELLDLLGLLEKRFAFADMDAFYALSRAALVKDECYYDRFDRAFGVYFRGLEELGAQWEKLIPEEWLRKDFMRQLSDEERSALQGMGGLEHLLEEFRKRLEEQRERHAGGNKWIGTGGTSPFGQDGWHPEGIRVGPRGGKGRAVKVWDRREFRNLDDEVQLGTRHIQLALRRLRRLMRSGAAEELDLEETISRTARNAGLLDLHLTPERHNAVKVLLFLDVGGSMDPHVRVCEELFSAAASEFKYLKYFYFHNLIYESVWEDNQRRHRERIETREILRTYASDYKVVFVGDASMAPYEILEPGGSIEHWNEEPGIFWLQQILNSYDKVAWLNPLPHEHWQHTHSVHILEQALEGRMYPLNLRGLEEALLQL